MLYTNLLGKHHEETLPLLGKADLDDQLCQDKKDDYLKEFYVIVFILTLEQIIVLNKYCTYNNPIPKISHVKTLQNSCKMRYKFGGKNNKKVRK